MCNKYMSFFYHLTLKIISLTDTCTHPAINQEGNYKTRVAQSDTARCIRV